MCNRNTKIKQNRHSKNQTEQKICRKFGFDFRKLVRSILKFSFQKEKRGSTFFFNHFYQWFLKDAQQFTSFLSEFYMRLERLATLQIGRQRRTIIVNVEIYQNENSSIGNNEQNRPKMVSEFSQQY